VYLPKVPLVEITSLEDLQVGTFLLGISVASLVPSVAFLVLLNWYRSFVRFSYSCLGP
jgi:hypothetical protein